MIKNRHVLKAYTCMAACLSAGLAFRLPASLTMRAVPAGDSGSVYPLCQRAESVLQARRHGGAGE